MTAPFMVLSCDKDLPPADLTQDKESQNTHPIELIVNVPQQKLDVHLKQPHVTVNPELTLKNNSNFGFRELVIFLSVILSLWNIWYTQNHHKKEKEQKAYERAEEEIDKFWFSTVVTPKVIEPCFNILDIQDVDNLDTVISELQNSLPKLQTSLNLIGSLQIVSEPETLKAELTKVFEELEDGLLLSNDTDETLVKISGGTNGEESEEAKSTPSDPAVVITQAQTNFVRFIERYRHESMNFAINQLSKRGLSKNNNTCSSA